MSHRKVYGISLAFFAVALYGILHFGSMNPAPAEGELVRYAKKAGGVSFSLELLLLQIFVILMVCRIFAGLASKAGQPRVVGEMLAGLALGPSLFGAFTPELYSRLFAPTSLIALESLSRIGLLFYLFVVGSEMNLRELKEKAPSSILISHMSILLPFVLGSASALALYSEYAPQGVTFVSFSLFMGIAMSITAFPVLARILHERGLFRSSLGTLALSCAAIDDVTAWCALAAVIGVIQASGAELIFSILLATFVYVFVMLKWIRPVMAKMLQPVRSGISETLFGSVVAFVILSCLITESIGIHALFGAFMAGVVLPLSPSVKENLSERVRDFSTSLMLPLFFALTGLRTEVRLLNEPRDLLVAAGLIVIAILGKWAGSTLAARFTGFKWGPAMALGVLMNTRGLMELVVLNIGYDLGIISKEIFTMLVLMALITTLMTGPLITYLNRVWDIKGESYD